MTPIRLNSDCEQYPPFVWGVHRLGDIDRYRKSPQNEQIDLA
jgi:hypothetical protein